MFGGTFPSITAAQIVALVGAIISLVVSFGVDISTEQQNAMLLLTGLVASALIVGDAAVRVGRNSRAGKENAAVGIVTHGLGEKAAPPSLPDVPPTASQMPTQASTSRAPK